MEPLDLTITELRWFLSDPVERLDIDFDAGPRADAGGAFYETHHTDSGFPLARATTTA